MSRKLTVKRWLPSTVVMTQPCLLELLRLMMRDNGVAGLSSGRSRGEHGACRMSSRHSQRSRRGCFVSARTICSSRKARRPDAGTKTDGVVDVEGLSTAYLELIASRTIESIYSTWKRSGSRKNRKPNIGLGYQGEDRSVSQITCMKRSMAFLRAIDISLIDDLLQILWVTSRAVAIAARPGQVRQKLERVGVVLVLILG